MDKNVQAKAEMLVRRPPEEVFEALVNPEITTKFWFTKSSGRVEAGKELTWEWEMYGVSSKVLVKEVERGRRILIEWDGYDGKEPVEWTLTPSGKDATFVSVRNWGFRGDEDDVVRKALDSTGGFTWLLAGLKAYLEHGVQLNLAADAHPKSP